MSRILDPAILKELMTVDDIMLILDVLGIKYRKEGIKRLVSKCPNPTHIDKKPSWDVNVLKHSDKFGVHSCFSCGFSGDIFHLVQHMLGLKTRFQALKFVSDLLNKTLDEEFLYERNLTHRKKHFEYRKVKVLRFKLPMEFELLDEEDEYWDYVAKRGITKEWIERAKIGKCLDGYYKKRIVVPIYKGKKIAFYFARNNDAIRKVPKEKRGLYPKFCKSSQHLYGWEWLDLSLDYVILVEGIFDCLRLLSLGYKNALCLFGNKISETQATQLKKFKKVILVPDADGELDLENMESTKGQFMVQCAYKYLVHSHDIKIVKLPENKDPGEATEKEIKEGFESMTSFFKKGKKATKVSYEIKKR